MTTDERQTILHRNECPICGQLWQELLNDLERLAHLIAHVLQFTQPKPTLGQWMKENAPQGQDAD